MATGFSWYPIGSLLGKSPSLPQVPLWLSLGGEVGEGSPSFQALILISASNLGTPIQSWRRGRADLSLASSPPGALN